jgi:hypothetical protein
MMKNPYNGVEKIVATSFGGDRSSMSVNESDEIISLTYLLRNLRKPPTEREIQQSYQPELVLFLPLAVGGIVSAASTLHNGGRQKGLVGKL